MAEKVLYKTNFVPLTSKQMIKVPLVLFQIIIFHFEMSISGQYPRGVEGEVEEALEWTYRVALGSKSFWV